MFLFIDQENFTDHFEEEKSVEDNLEFSEEEMILPISPIKEGRLNCEEHNRSFRNEKLDRNFVQIVVPRHEIERRINSFIERKRNEANSLNNELFLMNNIKNDNCARTAAHFNRSDGSKSHVPVVNVSNEYGPQTLNTCIGFSTQFSDTSPKKDLLAKNDFNRRELSNGKNFSFHNLPGIEERLVNLEEHLNIRDEEVSESSIFSRINAIEKRVLFLEGLSPEYFKNINLKLFKTRGERIDYDFQNSLNVPPGRVDEYDELEEEIEYDEIDEEEEEEYFETEEEELSEVKSVTGT
ncbi:MAP3K12-binding inhibitory protein 1 [Armadillidium vulgare]|nr:MAP3K12-binding inhibitory protein 1 [Armadillidium vulgare]